MYISIYACICVYIHYVCLYVYVGMCMCVSPYIYYIYKYI